MAQRLELQAILEALLGSRNVYFQPPANVSMAFPAIVYRRDQTSSRFADNFPYMRTKRYQVTVIDRDPDSDIPDRVGLLQNCLHDRTFVAQNLNHDVFNLYY